MSLKGTSACKVVKEEKGLGEIVIDSWMEIFCTPNPHGGGNGMT